MKAYVLILHSSILVLATHFEFQSLHLIKFGACSTI